MSFLAAFVVVAAVALSVCVCERACVGFVKSVNGVSLLLFLVKLFLFVWHCLVEKISFFFFFSLENLPALAGFAMFDFESVCCLVT